MSEDNTSEKPSRYERIVQAVGDPICTLSRDGRFQYVNAAFETLTGYEKARAKGEPPTLIFPEKEVDAVRDALDSLPHPTGKRMTGVETTVRTEGGKSVPVECRITVLPPEDDDFAVLVIYDITRLKEREKRLEQFASVVSHDLRNPLDVALGRVEMLPEIADLDQSTEAHLEDIHVSLKRMERIIEDVLTLSRERSEPVDTEPVDLSTVLEDAWTTVDTATATIDVEADRTVLAHRSRLRRLFENLFRNAIEHGGQGVTVGVGVEPDGTGSLRLWVRDDGAGIPDAHKARIFDDGFTTASEGTGLGLAIVEEVARAHGWQVSVGDDVSGGTRFELSGIQQPSG